MFLGLVRDAGLQPRSLRPLLDAFRHGGGVSPADLHEDVLAGIARFTAQWHENLLAQD